MTFEEWWDANDMDSDAFADYTSCEQVWNAAKKDLQPSTNDVPEN